MLVFSMETDEPISNIFHATLMALYSNVNPVMRCTRHSMVDWEVSEAEHIDSEGCDTPTLSCSPKHGSNNDMTQTASPVKDTINITVVFNKTNRKFKQLVAEVRRNYCKERTNSWKCRDDVSVI